MVPMRPAKDLQVCNMVHNQHLKAVHLLKHYHSENFAKFPQVIQYRLILSGLWFNLACRREYARQYSQFGLPLFSVFLSES